MWFSLFVVAVFPPRTSCAKRRCSISHHASASNGLFLLFALTWTHNGQHLTRPRLRTTRKVNPGPDRPTGRHWEKNMGLRTMWSPVFVLFVTCLSFLKVHHHFKINFIFVSFILGGRPGLLPTPFSVQCAGVIWSPQYGQNQRLESQRRKAQLLVNVLFQYDAKIVRQFRVDILEVWVRNDNTLELALYALLHLHHSQELFIDNFKSGTTQKNLLVKICKSYIVAAKYQWTPQRWSCSAEGKRRFEMCDNFLNQTVRFHTCCPMHQDAPVQEQELSRWFPFSGDSTSCAAVPTLVSAPRPDSLLHRYYTAWSSAQNNFSVLCRKAGNKTNFNCLQCHSNISTKYVQLENGSRFVCPVLSPSLFVRNCFVCFVESFR